MPKTDERVDLYIAASAEPIQPILSHLRKLVHAVCPKTEETIKWGMPCFEYSGKMMCYMTSFKQHCVFGFYKGDVMTDPQKIFTAVGKTAMTTFGKITHAGDLPSDKIIKEYIKEAMKLSEESATSKKTSAKKKAVK